MDGMTGSMMSGGDHSPILCDSCAARQSRLCSAMDSEGIRELDSLATRIGVDHGQYLFEEEDPTSYVYNIKSGMGLLERLSSDGRRQIMAFLYPGDFVGLMPDALLSVSAKALGPVTACRWSMSDMDRLMDKRPELEHRIRRIANRVLATTMDQVFVLGCKNAREKLAFFLLHMERRQKAAIGEAATIHLPMTRGDIADYLGVTVETISRVFSQIKKEGLIALPDPNEVVIMKRQELEDIAEYYSLD